MTREGFADRLHAPEPGAPAVPDERAAVHTCPHACPQVWGRRHLTVTGASGCWSGRASLLRRVTFCSPPCRPGWSWPSETDLWHRVCRATAAGKDPHVTIIREGFREYLDELVSSGYSVRPDEHGSDPDLIGPDGDPIESWREDFPYPERMDRDTYEEQKYALQIELLKFQYWIADTGQKHVILFEGRDAAGKGGTIKRFIEHLNPRSARVVALN